MSSYQKNMSGSKKRIAAYATLGFVSLALTLCVGCNWFSPDRAEYIEDTGKTIANGTPSKSDLDIPRAKDLVEKRNQKQGDRKLGSANPNKQKSDEPGPFDSDFALYDEYTNEDKPPAWWPTPFPPPETKGLPRFGRSSDLWLDRPNKRIVMAGRVVKRRGPMELFACLKLTKEYESIVAIRAKAYQIHTLLIILGFPPGRPVQWVPKFQPAYGPEVEITLHWTDSKGKRRQAHAQEWLRNVKTRKQLAQPWVFGGSGFCVSDNGTQRHYLAEDGDLICVSNFATAMLDIPIRSTQANDALLLEAFTERIPPVGAHVTVILAPKPFLKEPFDAPPPGREIKDKQPLREPVEAPPPTRP